MLCAPPLLLLYILRTRTHTLSNIILESRASRPVVIFITYTCTYRFLWGIFFTRRPHPLSTPKLTAGSRGSLSQTKTKL